MSDEKKVDDRLVHLEAVEQKENHDFSLRPKQLKEFIGQPQVQKIYQPLFLQLVQDRSLWIMRYYLVLLVLVRQH